MEIDNLRKEFVNELAQANTLHDTDVIDTKYLGRNGIITLKIQELVKSSAVENKETIKQYNLFKRDVIVQIAEKKHTLATNPDNYLDEDIDTSLPGIKPKIGHLHPTTQILRKINSFFRYYGYSVYEGPEIETNEYNFEKLNLPKDHPARELADTLYIQEPEILLRTHTSSVEARALMQEELPIRIVVPGKVYRNETENATNNSMFYQYEGLVVDKNISMADLKGTLNAFVKFLYGEDTITRFRCKYYPQVEPGAGLDVQCTFCRGVGCQVCKYRGFIEVLGAGMVHPNMLKSCNIDPNEWSGFAFGMGFDRLVMLSYGIDDVRKLYNGELTFEE
ncbi:MAG TPA: phenylalanine--tRNA ligase subunit alpha [Candidatus Nitrosocosmicus sp.]|nr:phenylalanine--tRNA ligase subunit alpha [Candidatus Nitrosocosmicus sp.]